MNAKDYMISYMSESGPTDDYSDEELLRILDEDSINDLCTTLTQEELLHDPEHDWRKVVE